MADPHIDLAMFALSSMYSKKEVDSLLELYFKGDVSDLNRIKIYSYISIGGLLQSNWSEFKSLFGAELGHYGDMQYESSKKFFNIVKDELQKYGIDLLNIKKEDIEKLKP